MQITSSIIRTTVNNEHVGHRLLHSGYRDMIVGDHLRDMIVGDHLTKAFLKVL